MEIKRYEKALECFKIGLEMYPKWSDGYARLGICYSKLGDKENYVRNLFMAYSLNRDVPFVNREFEKCKKTIWDGAL